MTSVPDVAPAPRRGRRFDPRHIAILMLSHAKYMVRGGSGITFVLIVMVAGITVAGIFIDPIDGVRRQLEREHGLRIAPEKFMEEVVGQLATPIAWWLHVEDTDPRMRYLLEEKPGLLSAMFLVLLWLSPFMIAFGAFNQLSGDIANRGLRYLLLRTSRLNIIVSRFVGTVLFSALTSLITMAVLVTYLAIRFPTLYPVGELVRWGLYGWGALAVFSLPYVAGCTLISAVVSSPFAALAVSQLAIGLSIVLIKYAKTTIEHGDVGWMDRLSPWGWKFDLLHPEPATVGLAVLVLLGFTTAFGLLATRHFLKRDL